MKGKNYQSSMARASMTLLMAILSTATVWAEDVSIGTMAEWNIVGTNTCGCGRDLLRDGGCQP